MNSALNRKEFDLEKSAGTLNALSPFNVLTRGYSIVHKGDYVVSSASEISDGDRITVRFRNDEATGYPFASAVIQPALQLQILSERERNNEL